LKNYTNSDYALNKHSEAIVYRCADRIVEVTLTDFLSENPTLTADDFRKLKEESDNDYYERDRLDYQETWKNVPFEGLSETELCSVPSSEDVIIDAGDEAVRQQRIDEQLAVAGQVLNKLTDIQRRRYLLHVVKGLSTRQIAEKEGVKQRSVMDSLEYVSIKIKKLLK
jgi:DNA-directed RNA polymerase specialized sigma24 family protein